MKAEPHPIEKEQVMAYLDGELSPDTTERVASHLADCAECRALEESLRGVSSNLLAWNVELSSALLTHGVNSVLRAENQADSRKRITRFGGLSAVFQRVLFSRWIWAGACGVVALMIVWKVFGPGMFSVAPTDRDEFSRLSLQTKLSNSVENPSLSGGGAGGGIDKNLLYVPGAGLSDLEEYKQSSITEPMIARTASLRISVKNFVAARAGIDRIVSALGGYSASMTINTRKGDPQSLEAELRVPAKVCDATLADLKGLGRVEQEQQGGEEVTAQIVDLDARLKNARITETRLEEILRTRTGKVGDVLEVEKEMANVREGIERMEGEQKQLHIRVAYSSIQLEIIEEYAASLEVGSSSLARRVRNTVVDGFRTAIGGVVTIVLSLLYLAPSLVFLGLIFFWPARWAWRRLHQAQESN